VSPARLLPTLLAVTLVAVTSARAEKPLAVVVGKRLRSMEAALEGIQREARGRGLPVQVFRLDQGANEVDRAARELARGEFTAVVSLGAAAESLVAERVPKGVRHVSTLVLPDPGAPARPDAPVRVPFDARTEEWVRLVREITPPGGVIGALASDAVAEARLGPLAEALARAERRLVIRRAEGTRGLTRALRELLAESSLLLLPRDRGLLSAVVVHQVMNQAHRAKVPVVTFSRGLLAAGATAALDLDPSICGNQAARLVLGEEHPIHGARLSLDRNRADHLGIRVTEELEAWLVAGERTGED
jgi:ABC-type uncharacterized transport system substrate-binding protein